MAKIWHTSGIILFSQLYGIGKEEDNSKNKPRVFADATADNSLFGNDVTSHF